MFLHIGNVLKMPIELSDCLFVKDKKGLFEHGNKNAQRHALSSM